MQSRSLKKGGGLLSLALCSTLYSVEFSYDGKNAQSHLSQDKKFILTTTEMSGNKLTFDYNPDEQGVKNPQEAFVIDTKGSEDVHDNIFTFNNGKVTQFAYSGSSERGKSYNNNFIINGGELGIVIAGFSNYSDAYENSVVVDGGTVTDTVYGANISGSLTNRAYNNTVEVRKGTVKNVVGAGTFATGSNGGDLSYNKVLISGGTITGNAVGAENLNTKSAYSNRVEITGGTFSGDIIGSSVDSADQMAINNTIVIDGGSGKEIVFTNPDKQVFYGGLLSKSNQQLTGDVFSNNTLVIKDKVGIVIKDIQNFEFIKFYLPTSVANNDIILNLKGTDNTDLSNSKIGVAMSTGGIKLNLGEKVYLIKKENGSIKEPKNLSNILDDESRTQRVVGGVSKVYTFTLSAQKDDASQDTKAIVATVSEIEDNKKQKNIAETSAMMGGIVNEGSEMTSSSGMKNALTATISNGGESSNFGALGGQNVRLNSGSYVDVKGFSFMVGVSKQVDDMFMYGAFVEAGFANYDSYNDFGANGSAHGWGDNRYYGGGLLSKFDMASNYYLEASLRVGKVYSDYKSKDINPNQTAKFKSSRMYWGGHVGFGKIFSLNDASDLDIYTKFFVTRLSSDEIEVVGEKIKYHNSNSIRARIGGRYSYYFDDNFEIYGGAAFEREFNSEAKATNLTQNQDLVSPTLKGNTAIGEFGFKFKTPFKPLTIDLNLQGLAGKREGFTGGINAEFKF
ncbi:autotransporter outer membrane beta-barrel domain-containing protein [Campylobacter mucosalis]|uniref:Putative autotransporter beta-domain protein n=1 Tax=Campylobacter mucosalis CCUG 21559 TaxID=1032067 RepID=A0A6G5QF97_9BACT|nr:autotransporter outer membrane beta-barrel domain-containing protein [Campylobacter mucosalis]QCD44383.1 putative autotransporter beta-domain protein [Campylobacter mucosalis CCUG 21559]